MMAAFKEHLQTQLTGIRSAGTYKNERVIITPQGTPEARCSARWATRARVTGSPSMPAQNPRASTTAT